ncbi:Retroviral aspartyl protease [Hydrogenobaculum acidophilum]
MKNKKTKCNLSKELFINSALIGMCALTLSSCGGGSGGGGSSSSNPSSSSQANTVCPTSSQPNSAYICQGSDYINEPIITVYIDGTPVSLLLDTGASGILVNQSAVNIPSSDYTNTPFFGTFGDGSTYSGTVASATVCLNPNYKNTCVIMPVNVDYLESAFPPNGESQGDFGIDCSANTFSQNSFCYFYYLEAQNGINSYALSFSTLSNTFYGNSSPNSPIGELSFGSYNNSNNGLISYNEGGFPSTTAIFSSYTSSIPSFTATTSFFDTGSNFNYLTTDVFKTEIPHFSKTASEGACYQNVLNGGLSISYNIQNTYSTTFLTEPPQNMCNLLMQPLVIEGVTLDAGSYSSVGYEDFGFPEMIRHSFIWILDNNGFVKYIKINN